MLVKDMTYTEKFVILKPLMSVIIEAIKKDLKRDHLRADRRFLKKYFPKQRRHLLEVNDLVPAYTKHIAEESDEKLAEYLCNRWLLRYTDLYDYFAERLSTIDADFDQLDNIDDDKGQEWVDGAIERFGAVNTYIFAVFNSVVFSEKLFDDLAAKAGVASAT